MRSVRTEQNQRKVPTQSCQGLYRTPNDPRVHSHPLTHTQSPRPRSHTHTHTHTHTYTHKHTHTLQHRDMSNALEQLTSISEGKHTHTHTHTPPTTNTHIGR